ncbi:hypothetical protein B296_00038567 [Ensete ventricosum]|uniref:Uncharacterized protein n=1 Tax=Ensete ventricosum TaxID=4639 RepID=A0A426Y880_ENSVE|nr:hypothetical protein B296_00038567 [Ensete ventricosum]
MLSVWPKSAWPRTHLAVEKAPTTVDYRELARTHGLWRSCLLAKAVPMGKLDTGKGIVGDGHLPAGQLQRRHPRA